MLLTFSQATGVAVTFTFQCVISINMSISIGFVFHVHCGHNLNLCWLIITVYYLRQSETTRRRCDWFVPTDRRPNVLARSITTLESSTVLSSRQWVSYSHWGGGIQTKLIFRKCLSFCLLNILIDITWRYDKIESAWMGKAWHGRLAHIVRWIRRVCQT